MFICVTTLFIDKVWLFGWPDSHSWIKY